MSDSISFPRIERKPLPPLPSDRVLEVSGIGEVRYDPDMWELEYATRRYLERTPNEELLTRFAQIQRNLRSLVGAKWDGIPIILPRSSWYWHRKEFQTRLELAIRDIPPPEDIKLRAGGAVFVRPDVPAEGVLFRFGQRNHMAQIVEGLIRFTPAQNYEEAELNVARRDEEKAKHAFSPGQYVQVTTMDGKLIPLLGNLKRTVKGTDYHMACFTQEWDEDFFKDFDADACVVINDPEAFTARIKAAGEGVFSGRYFMDCPVEYYDPFETAPKQWISPPTHKDFSFAYQREYRIFFNRLAADRLSGVQNVDIGRCGDLVTLYGRDGKPLS